MPGALSLRRRDAHRGLMAHPREGAKHFVARGRRRRRAVLRIERDDEDALAALCDELAELGRNRRIAVTHGPLDHEVLAERLERARELDGLRASDGLERRFVAFVVPDPGVVGRLFPWPDRQDHAVWHDLAEQGLILDLPPIAEKFLEIAPHGGGIGGLGRAEIDQQHADLAGDCRPIDGGGRGARFVHRVHPTEFQRRARSAAVVKIKSDTNGCYPRLVMRGLDPRIHRKRSASFNEMDCRVKPGNDGGWSTNRRWDASCIKLVDPATQSPPRKTIAYASGSC